MKSGKNLHVLFLTRKSTFLPSLAEIVSKITLKSLFLPQHTPKKGHETWLIKRSM